MKIAIIGAGAIGGQVGAKLALAGEDVTFVVRGANFEAISRNGVKLISQGGIEQVASNVRSSDKYDAIGVQDVAILAMKAHQIEGVVKDLPKLLGPEAMVVTMQNGIPFWYFEKIGGPLEGTRVSSVDPTGSLLADIPAKHIAGCVVYPASELIAPGVIQHIEGDRFPLGELDGTISPRVTRGSECFAKAGFKAPILNNIRSEIWLKLWGNMTFNPISALSHANLVDVCQFPLSRALVANMMSEAQAVGEKLGITFLLSLDKRIAGAEKMGKHKISMFQGIEAGRAPEIDALLGSVVELARLCRRRISILCTRWPNYLRTAWSKNVARCACGRLTETM